MEVQTDKDTLLANENVNSIYDNNLDHANNDNSVYDSNSIYATNLMYDNNNQSNSSNNIPEPNCLALTVRKDYNLMIVKNIFTATGRLSWKIVLATVVLNFLRMIF